MVVISPCKAMKSFPILHLFVGDMITFFKQDYLIVIAKNSVKRKQLNKRGTMSTSFFKQVDRIRKQHITTTTSESTYTANWAEEILQKQIAEYAAHMVKNRVNQSPTHSANAITGIAEDQIHKIITSAVNYHNKNKPNHNNDIRKSNHRRNNKSKAHALIDSILITYCWSHGITQYLYHNSCTCKRKKEGEKNEVIYYNRMGGSSLVLSERSSKKITIREYYRHETILPVWNKSITYICKRKM